MLDRVAPGLSFCVLGDMVCELGQGLRGRDADARGDADPAMDARPDRSGASHMVAYTLQVDKALIDAIDLLAWPEACSKAHFDHGITRGILERLADIITTPKALYKSATVQGMAAVVITLEMKAGSPILIRLVPGGDQSSTREHHQPRLPGCGTQ